MLSFVEGIGVIKSYNLLGEKSEELSGNFKRSRNTSLDFERKMTPWTMGLNILYGIGIAAIFGLSIVLEQSGALSLAYVLGVLLFVFDLFGPLKALYGEASRLTVMNAALDRIEAVLDEPELSDNGKQHIQPQAWAGYGTLIFGGYHLNKKKKSNKSGYPDEAIKTLARCFYPSMVEFFNSEEGQREYEEWLKEQEALQALPVAA